MPQYLHLSKKQVEIYLAQSRLYARWVREQIAAFEAQLIFDEMNLPEWEPFNRLEDLGAVPWMYMDIPENVRNWFKLSADRSHGNDIVPELDEPRERHWLKMIESVCAECKATKVAVLCGAAHLSTFSRKLIDVGHQVTKIDVRNAEWYDDSYKSTPSPW